jgi:hypothetical protein
MTSSLAWHRIESGGGGKIRSFRCKLWAKGRTDSRHFLERVGAFFDSGWLWFHRTTVAVTGSFVLHTLLRSNKKLRSAWGNHVGHAD